MCLASICPPSCLKNLENLCMFFTNLIKPPCHPGRVSYSCTHWVTEMIQEGVSRFIIIIISRWCSPSHRQASTRDWRKKEQKCSRRSFWGQETSEGNRISPRRGVADATPVFLLLFDQFLSLYNRQRCSSGWNVHQPGSLTAAIWNQASTSVFSEMVFVLFFYLCFFFISRRTWLCVSSTGRPQRFPPGGQKAQQAASGSAPLTTPSSRFRGT